MSVTTLTMVILTRTRDWPDEHETWSDPFMFFGEGEPEDAFRAAVEDYLETDDGKAVLDYNNNDFNWGDMMMHVPAEIFKIYGLKSADTITLEGKTEVSVTTVSVDQDEDLSQQ
jgi:hypothetical protein